MLMSREYFDLIRSGRKTTTLRYWKRRLAKPGGIHPIRGLGRLRILNVEIVAPEQLTEADATVDGFGSLAALLAAIDKHRHGTRGDGRQLYRVEFEYIG